MAEGRRSGLRYETPLEVVRYDAASDEATVVAGWGRRTAWLHNVEAGLRIVFPKFARAAPRSSNAGEINLLLAESVDTSRIFTA